MAKSKYKTYLITIEDIDAEGVSYGKWHFRSKYVVATFDGNFQTLVK